MLILILDNDEAHRELTKARLVQMGHDVIAASRRDEAAQILSRENVGAVVFDPAPLNNPGQLVVTLRRAARHYPYLILNVAEPPHEEDVLASGVNAAISKPPDPEALEEAIADAERMVSRVTQLGDPKTDFSSAGGVIAKSAINQLFLSCLDRAARYSEVGYMLFIRMVNDNELTFRDGTYQTEYVSARLAQHLVRIRRQSDILAQTDKHEFALLLQRPQVESEPKDAAQRFAASLESCLDIATGSSIPVEVSVELLCFPQGRRVVHYTVHLKPAA